MDLKTLHGKMITLLNLRNLKASKVILRGSTKKFLRYNIPGSEEMVQNLKEDHHVFPIDDFDEVNQIALTYLESKKAFSALSAIAI